MLSGRYRVSIMIGAALVLLPCPLVSADTLDDANARARQWIQQTMQEKRIPGLQVAVVRDGQLVLSESYGWANVENRVAATRTTLFPLNSATKPFTGVAMMQLAEAGLVDLDAPVSRYLDDLPEPWQKIRVRQLLAHTSGLPEITMQKGLIGDGTERDAWRAVQALPMAAPVGERFIYNQTNYGLLAQIVAKQTKLSYEQYLAERQFIPANMPLSTFGDSYDVVPNTVTIYSYIPRGSLAKDDGNRLSRWAYDIPYSLWAGGGMLTTADEVAHWIIALSSGRLISKSSLDSMWKPEKLNSGTNSPWGAGWPVLQQTPTRQLAGIGGARAAFILYPDDGLAIIVLTNLVGANPQSFIPQIAEFYKPTLGIGTK